MLQQGEYCCEETYEISTTFDPQQPEGVCVATRTCYSPPDYTQIIGAPVEGGVDPSFCEAPPPPTEEEALACPTDGTFDLYDAVSGEHIASGVAEADLPAGAEIVADDDPRCGPTPPPVPGPAPAPTPGAPFPGPIPTAPPGAPPMVPPSAPTAPGAAPIPGTDPFARGFLPCGAQPPINLRVLKTQTLPSRPDLWQSDWAQL